MEILKRTHPNDPREDDLVEDNHLWQLLLERFWSMKKEVYYIFHALRCGSSLLNFDGKKINFTFGKDLKEIDGFIEKIKKKYLLKHKDFIQIAMNTLAKDLIKEEQEGCPF